MKEYIGLKVSVEDAEYFKKLKPDKYNNIQFFHKLLETWKNFKSHPENKMSWCYPMGLVRFLFCDEEEVVRLYGDKTLPEDDETVKKTFHIFNEMSEIIGLGKEYSYEKYLDYVREHRKGN